MNRVNKVAVGPWSAWKRDQRGITGLETAIVLIAFVVVASVFAFAVLSTGLLSSEKAEESVVGGLQEGSTSLSIKGSVIAYREGATANVQYISIPIVAASTEAVDLSVVSLVVTYIDADQVVDLAQISNPTTSTSASGWNTSFRAGDTGPVLDPGERADFLVNLSGLTDRLTVSTEFTIQIKPAVGALLPVNRTTPGEVTPITNLN